MAILLFVHRNVGDNIIGWADLKLSKKEVLEMCLSHRDIFFETDMDFMMQRGQKEVSDAIIENVLLKTGKEIFHEVSRQSGKTTILVNTTIFLLLYIQEYWNLLGFHSRGLFEMGIFAPQFEQAKTAFSRLRYAMISIKRKYGIDYDESNGNTLTMNVHPYRSIVYVFSLTASSNIESKTMDFQIFDEAQKLPNEDMKIKAFPMTANTNGCRVFLGTAGFTLCYYYEGIHRDTVAEDSNSEVYVHDVYDIIEDKREMFEKTKNPEFLNYEKKFNGEVKEHGLGSDYIETQYLLKWKLEKGMFITPDKFSALALRIPTIKEDRLHEVNIGIDCAKESDYTVAVAWRWQMFKRKEWKQPKRVVRILDWYCINKELYGDQWEVLEQEFFSRYDLNKLNIDSTGSGDGTADWFLKKYDKINYDGLKIREKYGRRGVVRPIKFTAQSKNIMYKKLDEYITEGRVIVPRDNDSFGFNKFKMESGILIKEYKGDLMSVHHDDSGGATDDCWDALAVGFYDLELEPTKKSHGNIIPIKKSISAPQKSITENWLDKTLRRRSKERW